MCGIAQVPVLGSSEASAHQRFKCISIMGDSNGTSTTVRLGPMSFLGRVRFRRFHCTPLLHVCGPIVSRCCRTTLESQASIRGVNVNHTPDHRPGVYTRATPSAIPPALSRERDRAGSERATQPSFTGKP